MIEIVSEAIDLIDLINGEAQLEKRLFNWVNGQILLPLSLEIIQTDSYVAKFEAGRKIAMNHLVEGTELHMTAPDRRKFLEAQGTKISKDEQKKLEASKGVECAAKQEKVIETRFPLLELAESDDHVEKPSHILVTSIAGLTCTEHGML